VREYLWGFAMEVAIMDKRTKYVEKLSARIVEWDAQIDLLREKAENASPEVKFEYSKTIADLQLKRDEAAEKLQRIPTAGDDEWEEIKKGTEQILDEIGTALSDAIEKMR
jgi:hypothetical protein